MTELKPKFPSTHWSSILHAGKADTDEGRAALGRLLQRYKPALVAYLRSKFGYPEDQAEDLFQEFVLQIVMRRELITQAHPAKGYQFRKFLLTALHTFAVSEYRHRNAQKRQPEQGLGSLDAMAEANREVAVELAPGTFDVAWAQTVVSEALAHMEKECLGSGRDDVWGVFQKRLRKPILEGAEALPYDQLVEQFGFRSPAQAHNVLVTAKRMFARCLREVIAEYVSDENAIEMEIRELQIILAKSK